MVNVFARIYNDYKFAFAIITQEYNYSLQSIVMNIMNCVNMYLLFVHLKSK